MKLSQEKDKDVLDTLTSNNIQIEKVNKKEKIQKSLLTNNSNLDSKNTIIHNNELEINNEDRVVYDSSVFINIKKFNKNYDKEKLKK